MARIELKRATRRLGAATVLAVLAALLTPAVAGATSYGGAGRIAFTGLDALGNSHIWTMEADGSGKLDLTPLSTDLNLDADWSPSGDAIAFSRGASFGTGDIWRMDPAGGNLVQLTTAAAREVEPDWSPDGDTIVFESGNRIVTMSSVDGSGRTVIGSGDTPSYSPAGTRIVFARYRNGFSDIFSMNPDGSRVRNLTRTASTSEFNPDWSPDGRTIAFQRSQAPDHEIWTMRPDGSVRYRITHNRAFDGFPTYSPDGTAFVLVRNDRIVTINASGGPATEIAPSSMIGDEFTTSWQALACTITGTPGDDPALDGTVGDDVICGLGGDDVVHASTGDDTIIGGAGADVLYGEDGNDTIAGAAGEDDLIGGIGNDRLTGDGAKDIHRGGTNDDYLFAWDRAGGDRLICGTGSDFYAWEPGDIIDC